MALKTAHILIVEDEISHAKLIRRSFESCSDRMHLNIAFNLKEARTVLLKDPPDLIITDFLLPDGKGLELLQGHEKQKPFPLIVLTAHGDEGVAVEAMKAGALDYVVKSETTFADMPHIAERALREWDHLKGLERTQEELRESEERYRTIMQANPDPVVLYDLEGRVIYFNPAFAAVFGWILEERLGQKMDLFVPEEAWPETLEMIEKLKAGESISGFESHRYTKDRRKIPVSISGSIFRDKDGNTAGCVVTLRDISQQKKMEVQLQQAQKMESLGTLAGGIAHDFNNILFSIIGNAELLIHHELHEGHPARSTLEQILKASYRAADLVRQILTFSRKKEFKLTHTLITPIVKEITKLLRASLPATIEIKQVIKVKSDIVLGDPSQIHQVLMNLCANAAHAMRKEGGTLSIELQELDANDAETASYPKLNARPCLKLAVSDTGHGMEPFVMERIFDPYFTTKPMEEGTGLGLAVVHGIIRSFGGDIHVESEPGKGSTFSVFLPKVGKKAAPEMTVPEPVPAGNETILFVDDEESVARMVKQMLEVLGYNITPHTDSLKALEDFRRQPDAFDLVITDMTMPKMTGDKLAGEIIQIRAEIPVILCTGYTDLITRETAKHMGIREFVMKPLSRRQLAKTIRKVLDG